MAEKEREKQGDAEKEDLIQVDVTVGNTYRKILVPRGSTLADVIEILKKEGLLSGIGQFTIRLNDTFVRHNDETLETNPVITEDSTLSFLVKFTGGN
jgi:hypothetical protein